MEPHTILIIDQEEAVRDSLRLVLNEEGFCCYTANDEATAMQVLKTGKVELIILDSQVYGKTRLLEKIKGKYPAMNIILLSSYAEVEVTQQALNRGVDDFVLKPLDFDEIIQLVKKFISSLEA